MLAMLPKGRVIWRPVPLRQPCNSASLLIVRPLPQTEASAARQLLGVPHEGEMRFPAYQSNGAAVREVTPSPPDHRGAP